MIERKLNSGRSILEMLGVLAIIAVITLMGLGLIRFLINYAEAYSTIKSANETAMELRIRQGRGYLVENYWMFNANITRWEEQRVLTLAMRNTTPEDLCKAILRQAERNTEIIHVEPANCTADNNQVVFYFAFDEGTYHSPFTGNANTDKNDPLSGGCAGKSISNGECTYEDENCILRKDVGDSCGSGSICLYDRTDLVCRECPEELPDGVCTAWDGCDGLVDKADGDSCGENYQCQSGECVCTLKCQNGGNIVGDCQSCACVGHWGGEDCSTCTENWTGDDCQTCGLSETDCAINGKVLNSDTCSCECLGNWAGENCDECNLSISQCGTTQAIDENNCLCVCETEGYTGYYCSYSCPTATGYVSGLSKSACEACGDEYIWSGGYCYGCGYSSTISFPTEAEAKECMNMCAGSGYERYQNGNYCYLPTNTTCPSITSYTYNVSKSVCEGCDSAFWKNGYCYGCGRSSGMSYSTEAEAEACVTACVGSGYERYQSGTGCNLATNTTCPSATSYTYQMSKSVCEGCGNTVWKNGTCYGCGYSGGMSYSTEAEAEACEAACSGSGYNRIAEGTYCYLPTNTTCPSITSYTSSMSKSVCEACGNTVWNNGTCYGCGYPGVFSFNTEAEAEACEAACSGSGYERYQNGNYCYLATNTTCPSITSYTSSMSKSVCEACGNTVWNNGTCYGCGYPGVFSFNTEAEAEACEAACSGSGYERYQNGNYCYLATNTTCPSATSYTSEMSKSVCEACDNTFWRNGWCYGCGYSSVISCSTEAEAEECEAACADSGYERYQSGSSCYLPTNTTCPSITSLTSGMFKSACEACGNAFWINGRCYGCGYSAGVSHSTEAEAEACVTACADSGYNRIAEGRFCHIPTNTTCPSITSYTYNMSKSACEACDNTVWSLGYCYGYGHSGSISYFTEAEAKECMNACAGSGYPREVDKSGDRYYCNRK